MSISENSINGVFKYTQPITDYVETDLPFINEDKSFETLTKTTSVSGSNTIVSWAYVFNDSGTSSVDGLYLNGTITTPGNMTIDNFGSIPMSRQGRQFRSYTGSFPSTNTPTLLANTSCFEMFYGASNFNQDIGGWDTSTVTNMSYMFYGASNFNQNIGGWDTSTVTNMSNMFYGASNFNQAIGGWNVQNIISMSNMLDNTSLSIGNYNATLNGWGSQLVKNNIQLSSFKLKYSKSGVNGRSNLINNYNWVITGDIFQPQDTTELQTAVNEWIVNNSQALIDYGKINTWDTSLITDMSNLFEDKKTFNENIGNWDVSNVNNMLNMLDNSGLSVDNYNNTLYGWASQIVQQNITLGAEGLKYSSVGEIGRETLINDYKWDIKGDSDNNSIITIFNIDVPPLPQLLIKDKFISSTIFNGNSSL